MNLVRAWLGDFSVPQASLRIFDIIQLVDGLVWRIQDGFVHISGVLVGMAESLDLVRTINQSTYMWPL